MFKKLVALGKRFLFGPLGKPLSVGLDGKRLSQGTLGPHAVWVQSLGTLRIDIAGSNRDFQVFRRRKILGIIPWTSVFAPGTNDQTQGRVVLYQHRWMGVVTYTIVENGAKTYAGMIGIPYGWRSKVPLPMKVGVQDRTPKS